jgi:hypothetical protein
MRTGRAAEDGANGSIMTYSYTKKDVKFGTSMSVLVISCIFLLFCGGNTVAAAAEAAVGLEAADGVFAAEDVMAQASSSSSSLSASSSVIRQYKISDVTVSGVSSGGYMAVQLHVAHSSIISGCAAFAAVSLFIHSSL